MRCYATKRRGKTIKMRVQSCLKRPWTMPEAEAAPFQVSGFTRTHREARASSETVNKDDVEEVLRNQALWEDHQNARP